MFVVNELLIHAWACVHMSMAGVFGRWIVAHSSLEKLYCERLGQIVHSEGFHTPQWVTCTLRSNIEPT